jgi:long-subunit fatty acid transport protein
MTANAMIPFIPGGYMASTETASGIGYLVGAAYERPDIALRVALTYNSAISHDLPTTETSALGAGRTSTTKVDTPQSVNLDFQTGIAKDTLIFGGIRWAEWTKFDISPADYSGPLLVNAPLVSYNDDIFTYTLGVGRRLNENWAVAGSVAYEKQNGGFASNLNPTDGKTTLGVGVTYSQDNMKITAGVSHTWVGDAQTQLGGSGLPAGVFEDNSATAFGMKVGFNF